MRKTCCPCYAEKNNKDSKPWQQKKTNDGWTLKCTLTDHLSQPQYIIYLKKKKKKRTYIFSKSSSAADSGSAHLQCDDVSPCFAGVLFTLSSLRQTDILALFSPSSRSEQQRNRLTGPRAETKRALKEGKGESVKLDTFCLWRGHFRPRQRQK